MEVAFYSVSPEFQQGAPLPLTAMDIVGNGYNPHIAMVNKSYGSSHFPHHILGATEWRVMIKQLG